VTQAAPTIATADLEIGMFVHLDLGWMSHPFALSSFRITDANQIATIRSLGLARVRWSPEQSEVKSVEAAPNAKAADAPAEAVAAETPPDTLTRAAIAARTRAQREASAAHRAATLLVERQYGEAARDWRGASELALTDPTVAGQRLMALSRALVDKMLGARELSIRAVAAPPADRASHALNVGVISLLMGKLCGLSEADLQDLGTGALSHDIGKLELPTKLHKVDDGWTSAETARYRDHVALGVALGKRMGLAPGALLVIGQHHEHCDGSGFPQGVDLNRMSVSSRVVALVNRYDNLCHPAQAGRAMTPHEALSLLFSQGQKRYDPAILNTFVRMMGVYPPGSVVQLTDDRWAVVESVNAARPLKPRVSVHTPGHPADEAPMLDLATEPSIGIRRSVPVAQLPRELQESLAPRSRSCWFFESADGEAPPERTKERDTCH
jgi:HD-GYP domain-containing protein (c-di-GMP phosphodiesterase class II)